MYKCIEIILRIYSDKRVQGTLSYHFIEISSNLNIFSQAFRFDALNQDRMTSIAFQVHRVVKDNITNI